MYMPLLRDSIVEQDGIKDTKVINMSTRALLKWCQTSFISIFPKWIFKEGNWNVHPSSKTMKLRTPWSQGLLRKKRSSYWTFFILIVIRMSRFDFFCKEATTLIKRGPEYCTYHSGSFLPCLIQMILLLKRGDWPDTRSESMNWKIYSEALAKKPNARCSCCLFTNHRW